MTGRATTGTARIGLIGYGLAGSAFHAPIISTTDGLELAAIVTGSAPRADEIRQRYPTTAVVADVAALWDLNLDAAVVATPNDSHAQLANDCIDHGIGAVVDKPMALTSAQAAGLITAADAAHVLLTTYQNRRWDGDFLTATELVEAGTLGTVTLFESRFEKWRPEVSAAWKDQTRATAGGGILLDLGAHLIDQAVLLFGTVTGIYAEVDAVRPGAIADDNAFLALTHASGTHSHLTMRATAADLGPRLRLLGTEGAYVTWGLDPQEAALRRGDLPGTGWGVVPEDDWGVVSGTTNPGPLPTRAGDYPAFYRALAAALRDGGPPPVDPSDALTTLRIIEAARESSASRTVVNLAQ
ncbi:MAG: Gfo/Idh/MocA family oxidoreductase [Candidatus Nanopelagicales bacterium]